VVSERKINSRKVQGKIKEKMAPMRGRENGRLEKRRQE